MTMMLAPFMPKAERSDPDGRAAIAGTGGAVHWLRAADGLPLRTAHWPAEDGVRPRGTVLLLNGRAEFIEKHLEAVGELRRRGFAVWTLDWRGQGCSGRLLADPEKGHVRDFGDYLTDLAYLVREKVVPSLHGRPLLLLAHSMGGNIALRYLTGHPGLVQGAILSAPMVDFRRSMPLRRALALTGLICAVPGLSGRYNGGHRRAVLAAQESFEANPFSTCPLRLARTAAWLAHDPQLRLGASTWGWSRAALRSVAALADPDLPGRISIPILMLAAEDERVTDNAAIARFCTALPQGRLELIPGARHELLCEADGPRARFWQLCDVFLDGLEDSRSA